jgi:hypothetical protein
MAAHRLQVEVHDVDMGMPLPNSHGLFACALQNANTPRIVSGETLTLGGLGSGAFVFGRPRKYVFLER